MCESFITTLYVCKYSASPSFNEEESELVLRTHTRATRKDARIGAKALLKVPPHIPVTGATLCSSLMIALNG